jgi:hypothetical protein
MTIDMHDGITEGTESINEVEEHVDHNMYLFLVILQNISSVL